MTHVHVAKTGPAVSDGQALVLRTESSRNTLSDGRRLGSGLSNRTIAEFVADATHKNTTTKFWAATRACLSITTSARSCDSSSESPHLLSKNRGLILSRVANRQALIGQHQSLTRLGLAWPRPNSKSYPLNRADPPITRNRDTGQNERPGRNRKTVNLTSVRRTHAQRVPSPRRRPLNHCESV